MEAIPPQPNNFYKPTMRNPIKAYANLNQANRRWVTLGAAAIGTLLTGGSAVAVAPIAYGAAIADGAHFHKNQKVGVRLRAGLITFVVAAAGAAPFTNTETTVVSAPTPAPIEQVVEAPTPIIAPVVATPPVAPTYEFTYEGAKTEICEAAHQYRGDVTAGYMDTKGARYELSSYAKYLAKNSPAGGMELLTVGKACFGF